MQNFRSKKLFLSLLLLASLFASPIQEIEAATIIVPPAIALSINGTSNTSIYYNSTLGPSTFDYQATLNDLTSSAAGVNEYTINGALYTNCGRNGNCNGNGGVYLDVIPMKVTMTNAGQNVTLNLSGTVGGKTISTSSGRASSLTFTNTGNILTLPWKANLQIKGDLDSTTLNTRLKPGTFSGTMTVQITIP